MKKIKGDYKVVNKGVKEIIIKEAEQLGFERSPISYIESWTYSVENGSVYHITFNMMVMNLISFNNKRLSLNRLGQKESVKRFYKLMKSTFYGRDERMTKKLRDYKLGLIID